MISMKDQLLNKAIDLVRVRGYAAFSYADLSEAVGIRKPSIHHHFPSKEDLGEAIVEIYSDSFFERLDRIDRDGGTVREKIKRYADIYREALKADQGCLCGMLAYEVAILPERIQTGVKRFFERNIRWLENVLAGAEGERAGSHRRAPARIRAEASLILGSLQGALFVARSMSNAQMFEDAVKGTLERIE